MIDRFLVPCLRFCIRCSWAPVTICAPVCLVAILWAAWVHGPLLFMLGASALVILFAVLFPTFAGGQLVVFAIEALHKHCDPQPLLEETEKQLPYVRCPANRAALTINHCAALLDLGRHEEALAELEALDIQSLRLSPIMRVGYYHNLTTAAIRCNQSDKATAYYRQTAEQAGALIDKEQRAATRRELMDLQAALLLSQGEADKALSLLTNHPADHLYQRVHHAFLLTQVATLKKDDALAQTQLAFIQKNGGNLYVAILAESLIQS